MKFLLYRSNPRDGSMPQWSSSSVTHCEILPLGSSPAGYFFMLVQSTKHSLKNVIQGVYPTEDMEGKFHASMVLL